MRLHMLRSMLTGIMCAALCFSFLVGCNKEADEGQALKVDSGAVTMGEQTFQGKKIFTGNSVELAGSNATAIVLRSGATANACTSLLFGSTGLGGPRVRQLDETVTFSAGALSKAMTTQVPAGAIILSVQGYVVTTLVAGGNTVTWSLGPASGTLNAYGTAGYPSASDSLVAASKSWWLNSGMTRISSANAVTVYAAQTSGTPAGTANITAGAVRVLVTYIDCKDLGASD